VIDYLSQQLPLYVMRVSVMPQLFICRHDAQMVELTSDNGVMGLYAHVQAVITLGYVLGHKC